MKTKTYRGIIPFFLFLMLILTILPISVYAATGSITVEDWESYNAGVTSGSNSYLTWESWDTQGQGQVTTGARSGNCIYFHGNPSETILYVNLTDDYSYISEISIWVEGATSAPEYITFYNSSTNVVANIKYDDGANRWMAQTIDAGWSIFSTGAQTEDGWLNITHNSGNNMTYSWYNSADGSTDSNKGASYNSNTWTNITRIKIESGTGEFRIDDIVFSFDSSNSTAYCDLSDYSSICSGPTACIYAMTPGGNKYIEYEFPSAFTGTIHGVLLPISSDQYNQVSNDKNDYRLYVDGVNQGFANSLVPYGCGYGLYWCDLSLEYTNQKPLFGFSCDEYVTYGSNNYYWYGVGLNPSGQGFSTYHNSGSLITNGAIDGNVFPGGDINTCFYYSVDPSKQGNEELPASDLENYSSEYGDFFIQFYGQNIQCEYRVGDHPVIIYNLTDAYFSSTCEHYVYIIKNQYNDSLHFGTIAFTGSDENGWFESDYIFTSTGTYTILLYNVSDYCTNLESMIAYSLPITVCLGEIDLGDIDSDGDGVSDLDELNDGTDPYDADDYTVDYTTAIAFVACLVVGLFVGFITMSGVAFVGGFLGSMVFMSIPNQPFTFFGLEVLSILSFMLILIFIYMLYKR